MIFDLGANNISCSEYDKNKSGEEIHLTDSTDNKAVEYSLFGKATQNGEPTPENPVDIETSGESYNLLENTATSQTINGVEFVVNEDKSISVKGTATNLAYINVGSYTFGEKVILSGCPSGGKDNTYSLYAYGTSILGRDVGSGAEIQANEQADIRLMVASGVTIDKTFYPMIRKASVKNDRYMPYGKGSVEVKSVGGKNHLPYPYEDTTHTQHSVTWTDVGDGIIVANGTASNVDDYNFYRENPLLLRAGTYILSGCPSGGELDKTYFMLLGKVENGVSSRVASDSGNGATFTLEKDTNIFLLARVMKGVNANNLVFKPMIRLASDTDSTYEPYKETLTTIPTPNGLAGIKVSSNGNYTDQNGQQWICDEIVKYADGTGKYIQRIDVVDLGSLSWQDKGSGKYFSSNDLVGVAKEPNTSADYVHALSTCFVIKSYEYMGKYNNVLSIIWDDSTSHGQIWCRADDYSDTSTFLEKVSGQYLYYELAEPVETPLTAEEIETFCPVTNISNDFDCGMSVKYITDRAITTQTPVQVPTISDDLELKSGDTTFTLFGKIKKCLSLHDESLANGQVKFKVENGELYYSLYTE